MARELLLLRHGKSDWQTDDVDFERPLTDRGKRAAQRMGTWLAVNGMKPDYVVSSPAQRALLTAEKSSKAMGQGADDIVQDRLIYGAGISDLMNVIHKIPDSVERAMLVGHNPGLEDLLVFLAPSRLQPTVDGKLMPTATLAILEIDGDWTELQQDCVRKVKVIRPRSLPKKFPWPLMAAREHRDRPAYYYSQSSVLPYRLRDGALELLVIQSSKKKHWVVPKGIHEPGLTAQESAAKEAFEEAGVEGVVDNQALGNYRYKKWGATCSVDVYAMQVNRVLPESEWEESHRTRQWVSPAQAAELVKQQELRPLIAAFAKTHQAG